MQGEIAEGVRPKTNEEHIFLEERWLKKEIVLVIRFVHMILQYRYVRLTILP